MDVCVCGRADLGGKEGRKPVHNNGSGPHGVMINLGADVVKLCRSVVEMLNLEAVKTDARLSCKNSVLPNLGTLHTPTFDSSRR